MEENMKHIIKGMLVKSCSFCRPRGQVQVGDKEAPMTRKRRGRRLPICVVLLSTRVRLGGLQQYLNGMVV